MLIKRISKYCKIFFSTNKKSVIHNANVWLKESLASLNSLNFFDENINYQGLFLKIANNTLLSKNIKFLSIYDKEDLIINSYVKLFDKSFLSKCIKSTSTSQDFQKYISTCFKNILNSQLTVLINKNKKDQDVADYDFDLSKKDVESFLDILEYNNILDSLTKYVSKNPSCKGKLKLMLDSLLLGETISDFSKKNNISYQYSINIFQALLKSIYEFSVANNYRQIENHLKKFKSFKKSIKTARAVKIQKQEDILSDTYFREKTMDPKTSSYKIKESISAFINSFDDETDMIEEDNLIISIRSV